MVEAILTMRPLFFGIIARLAARLTRNEAGQVHINDALPFLQRELVNVHAVLCRVDPSVVHHYVQATVTLKDFIHPRIHLGFATHVHRQGCGGR